MIHDTLANGSASPWIYFFRWMMDLLTTPAAVELLVWIGDRGCFQPISNNIWRMGTISLSVMCSAPSSDSAAEDMTNFPDH